MLLSNLILLNVLPIHHLFRKQRRKVPRQTVNLVSRCMDVVGMARRQQDGMDKAVYVSKYSFCCKFCLLKATIRGSDCELELLELDFSLWKVDEENPSARK